jgi:Tfp pilus assembly protein PilE
MMRALGYVTLIEMVAAGAVLGVLAAKGLPDARRYIEMRKM